MNTSSSNLQSPISKIQCIILAAGQGTRMKSARPKVLHAIAGRPMIDYVIDTALSISSRKPIVVVGFGADQVQHTIGDRAEYVLQAEQKGTGHAMLQAAGKIAPDVERVVLVYGDGPFITSATLQQMLAAHEREQAALTLLTLQPIDPSNNYGRIIRDEAGRVTSIIEYKELAAQQRHIDEVNAGPVCYEAQWLLKHLPHLKPQAGHGELYLTDLVALAANEGATIATYQGNEIEVMGINDRVELSYAERIMRDRINQQWMLNGVTLIDPLQTYIEASVKIGQDTLILPNTTLEGKTEIGSKCVIGPNSIVRDSVIGNECEITASMLEGATLEDHVSVGPFSHMRKGAYLAKGVHVGNFAEVKNSRLGQGAKQGHFSYLGDATIGANVNIGAGTITANFDGEKKLPTEIGDDTFIGVDTLIVAPRKIGKRSKTGAGSVVTHDVGDDELVYGVPARKKGSEVGD
jgi:bifunctional UDP-N-acetylglucosamine pyrophosphorylase/glucosamine-1-phosphate N-acetyltransferase